MMEKSCGWRLIWYLLFFCHGGAEGQLQWVVKEKVTAYGQNLILFCPIGNCCSEPAGWSVGPKAIILDVKTFSNYPQQKYHGEYNKDGFGVVIRNLSEADLNVTYRCVYGFDQSTPKYLLHGDVFRENVPDKEKENDITATIIVVPSLVIMVLLGIGRVAYCVYRSRIKKERQKQTGTGEETKHLTDSENQQGVLSNRKTYIPTYPQGMHAVLGRITVTMLPKMCQQILESIISADNLYHSFQNRDDLRIILVKEELEIINTMVSNGYTHFTVQLCYKILRHEQWVGTPRQKWGNVPLHTDIHISDDIERIRLSRNKIVSMETKSLDKTTFLTLIDEFKKIAKRVEFYIKKDVMFLYQIQPTEPMTKAEVESTVEEIRRLSVIEDNPFPVHTINQGMTNYARLGLVVNICSNILREIMRSTIAPEVLYRIIKKDNLLVFDKMTHKECASVNTLSNGTYDNIDFITLYKLMRYLSLLDDPKQGWGELPTNADVAISDDVERLRIARNKIVHSRKAGIDLIDMNDYFSNIVNITQRINTYLGKLPDQGFAREVFNCQIHCMDSEMEQNFYQDLKDIEDIKEKCSAENVHSNYGITFSDLIQDAKN